MQSLKLTDLLNKAITTGSSMLSQVGKVTNAARTFTKSMDTFVNMCDSFASQVVQPINAVEGAINYAEDMPSRVIGSVQKVTDRLGNLVQSAASSPVQMSKNFKVSIDNLSNSITDATYGDMTRQILRVIGGAKINHMLSDIFVEDETKRATQARQMVMPSFDVNGNRILKPNAMSFDFLSIDDIEKSLYDARSLVQDALDYDRNNQPLKDLTSTIIRYIDDIKVKKQEIKTVTINSMPYHVLCQQMGLPYDMAERLCKINPQVPCPTFASGEISVYIQV
jgi:hypothetical protein